MSYTWVWGLVGPVFHAGCYWLARFDATSFFLWLFDPIDMGGRSCST